MKSILEKKYNDIQDNNIILTGVVINTTNEKKKRIVQKEISDNRALLFKLKQMIDNS